MPPIPFLACVSVAQQHRAVMGVYDIIPPSILAREDKQPFLLVKLRIKQKDVDYSQEKVVLRAGTDIEFKVVNEDSKNALSQKKKTI